MSQPWKAFWPVAPENTFINPNLSVVVGAKGALPHNDKFADGTRVMRLDNMKSFAAEVTNVKDKGDTK